MLNNDEYPSILFSAYNIFVYKTGLFQRYLIYSGRLKLDAIIDYRYGKIRLTQFNIIRVPIIVRHQFTQTFTTQIM